MTIMATTVRAQDVEKVLKADSVSKAFLNKMLASPIVLNGQLSARAMLYIDSTRNTPFTYLFNGAVNIKFMEYTMPLSFTYTNKGLKYAASSPLKFNRFNFSPHYKWIRLYLGTSSMSFSTYTLGGAQFKGIGIELTPKFPLSGSMMYGRFYDPVEYDPETPYTKPVFKRTGYACRLAFQKDKFQVETSLLNAFDDPGSITLPSDTGLQVAALQNVAVNFKSRFNPLKGVNLDVEYAGSAVNYRLLYKREKFFDMLFNKDAGVSRYKAYKLNLNFAPGAFSFGAGIEHIDPDYITLGAYYSQNDFQNITLNITGNVLKNKFNFALNGGLQNDNLKNYKQRKTTRTVGSASMNFMPSQKWSMNMTYSNFQTFSNIKNQFDYINSQTPFDNLDTLNYQQINQNASTNFVYKLKQTEKNTQVMRLMCNLSQTAARQGEANTGTRYINLNGSWSSNYPATKALIAAGLNSSYNLSGLNRAITWGPVLTCSRPFLDELLATSLSVAYNQAYINGKFSQSVFNLRGTADYTYRELHKFRLEMTVLIKKVEEKKTAATCNITLSYMLVFKKKEVYLDHITGVFKK